MQNGINYNILPMYISKYMEDNWPWITEKYIENCFIKETMERNVYVMQIAQANVLFHSKKKNTHVFINLFHMHENIFCFNVCTSPVDITMNVLLNM